MPAHSPDLNYDNYSADELRQAAQLVSADLAREPGTPSAEYVEQQQDLKTWMVNEAARRS